MRAARCLVVTLLGASGCLPIPMRKTYVAWPAGTVHVVDAETGAPLPAAAVVVTRIELPYSRRVAERKAVADATGSASFAGETEVKTVYPLMMHGVPQNTFEVCAEARGRAAHVEHWGDEGGALTVALHAGSRPCNPTPNQTVPAPGTARVEGVERGDGGTWRIQLALRTEEPAQAGGALVGASGTKAEIASIEHTVEAQPGLTRALVEARGDATFTFGQVVTRGAPAPSPPAR